VNALQKTLAIIAFLILATQTVRHTYVRWLEPRTSVLDKYDQPLKNEITSAASVDELLRRYEPVRKQADAAREELSKTGKKITDEQERELEPYKSEHALHNAITEWEERSKEIHELRFFWLAGLAFCVLGFLTYKKLTRWFGLAFLIAGFAEFIYATCPTLGRGTQEFDRLLVNKLIFSVVSLALLLTFIWLNRIFASEKEQSKP
jgi:hypothetical protein